MAKLSINRGTNPNDGTGDNLRDGANKINLNFDEIYTAIGDGTTVDGTWKLQDDSSTEAIISANGEVLRILGGTAVTSTLSGNDLTIALDTSTVVTATGTTTLTNKSIALGSNTVTGTTAQFNTALTDGSFATLAGSEALTNKTIVAGSNTISGITNSMLSGSAGITNANLANSTISISDDSSSSTSISLGSGLSVLGGTGISTTLNGTELTASIDNTVATLAGSQSLTNKTISGASNTLSNIGNSSLTNSSVTIGADTIALGGTQTTITDLNLDGTSSLSGTGTISTTGSANKIRFNYANVGSLPTAATYEGMFAYDIDGNQPYVADAGGWVKLVQEGSSIELLGNVGSISSISNGQALIWNSAGGRFDPGSVGSTLTIEEEGSALSTSATTIDFVGEGVTASGTGAEKTINIPGGAVAMYDVTANGSSAYRFSSHYGPVDNPTLYVRQGQSIAFNLNGLAGSHPFVLQTSSGSTYTAGNRITTGLTHIATDGTVSTGVNAQNKNTGILYFEVPYNQTTIYYICASHGGMNGTLSVNPKVPGLANSQLWLLTSNLSTTGSSSFADITANLSESSLTGYGRLGDAMTVSSGVFTFPSTGIWEVEAVYNFTGADGYGRGEIQVTTNNSSYSTVAQGQEETDNQEYANLAMMAQVDVTDTSQVKVKFRQGGTVNTLSGDSSYMRTGFKFKRLGDT